MERLRSAAVTRTTYLEKPAFRIKSWTMSTREVGGSLGLDGTPAHRTALVSPTAAAAFVVR